MTGRAKARLAVVGLLLVLLGLGGALATSRAARVRFLAWRMRSADLATRRRARERLLAIGRPAIDGVFPELVASEACDRVPLCETGVWVAFVGRHEPKEDTKIFTGGWDETTQVGVEERHTVEISLRGEVGPVERAYVAGEPNALGPVRQGDVQARREIVVASRYTVKPYTLYALLVVPLTDDDPLAASIIEEAKARLPAVAK